MTNNPFFDDDWLRLQRDYWEGLNQMGRQAMGLSGAGERTGSSAAAGPSGPAAPWLAALEQWWKTLSPSASDPARAFMERLLEQGRVFLGMTEQFLPSASAGSDPTQGWEALTKTLDTMQQAFRGAGGEADPALRRMLGFWEMPLDNWQRMISSLTPMVPGDWLRNMPHQGAMPGPLPEGLERMLSAPGLGYTREQQAQYQQLARCGLDYQRAFAEYAGFFSRLGLRSVERLRELLQQRSADGKPIDSARGLYDTWIECCESVYAEEVATPEYARVHGRLINAQMALKQRLSLMVDESLGAMNMPTRGELRTLQDRVQETRRENQRLRRELDAVQRRLATLPSAGPREALRQGPQQPDGQSSDQAAAQPAPRRSAAPKKKTTPRKKTSAQRGSQTGGE